MIAWLRSLFCRHQWRVMAIRHTPPVKMDLAHHATSYHPRAAIWAIRLARGFSHVMLTCDRCGARCEDLVDGRAQVPLTAAKRDTPPAA
jgi:hypothetical protein